MNEGVQDFVSEPVELTGKLVQYDDWIVIYVNNTNGKKLYDLKERSTGSSK
ncbi:MAG: hypothetical protein M3Z92_08635 [Bacteroidota bacterium]|nr:hypothetical protein [Bacteroidota bacterium]